MSKIDNDLFYTCSLIENISRETKQRKHIIVSNLGIDEVKHIHYHAEVLHCEDIKEVTERYINKYNLKEGIFDSVATYFGDYKAPSIWDMGKVYTRLIQSLNGNIFENLMKVYLSWIPEYLDDYGIAVYFMPPEQITEWYHKGRIE